jgi:hypothetical protein
MKYYFKLSWGFLWNIFGYLLFSFFAWIHVIGPRHSSVGSFDFYFYLSAGIIWLLIIIIGLVRMYAIIGLVLKKHPLLEVNEVWLYDYVNDIKFYWDDIEEISNDEYVLLLKAYDPSKYLNQFRRPIDSFYSYSKKKKVFKISLDYIKADLKNLGETLNNFSIQALAIQEGKK